MKSMQKMVNGSKIICSYPLMDGHPIDVQSINAVCLILQHRTEGLPGCEGNILPPEGDQTTGQDPQG